MGWKNCCTGCLIFVLLFAGSAHGLSAEELFEYLSDYRTINSVTEIKYDTSEYDKGEWMTQGKSQARLNIVGYEHMVRYDDMYYINQSPEKCVFVVSDIHTTAGDGWNYNVDYFKADIIEQSYDGNRVIVVLETKLKYHFSRLSIFKGRAWIRKTYYYETKRFAVVDNNPPQIYPADIETQNATVMIYNNSHANKTIISVPFADYMLGYRVEFKNESAEYYSNTMKIDHLDNGFPYGNVTTAPTQSIYEDSSLFSRLGDKCLINDSQIDDTLKIYAVTPYSNQEMNYSVVNMSTETVDKHHAVGIFNILATCFLGVFIIKYYRGGRS